PKLVILVGLPGSGKSHLVTTLMQGFPEHFERISQDELGSRAVCERLLAQNMRRQQQSLAVRGPGKALPMTVFIDRCNPTMAERKEWYELAFQPDETAMVWFSRNIEQCIKRVDSRENHPTVEAGKGDKVVRSFAKGFEFPN
ncbi:AAA domain-domain-containing protein, partial [Lobosporangium transversale]